MNSTVRIASAQVNFLVGNIEQHTDLMIQLSLKARDELKADVIIFPELSLTAYSPEDLLFRKELYSRLDYAFEKIKKTVHGIKLIVGYPEKTEAGLYNAACVIENGQRIANYRKQCLPNYGVFDEKRYFIPGDTPCVLNINGIPTCITICEDIWFPAPTAQAKAHGAQLMLCINASPFDIEKPFNRQEVLRARAQEGNMPIVYVHWVGGHDEWVFDGGSFVVNAKGDICHQSPYFQEDLSVIELTQDQTGDVHVPQSIVSAVPDPDYLIYNALVLGVRDYSRKNGFSGALVATSGGIDSALTLAIAVDALGKDNVEAYFLPSDHTSHLSEQGFKEEVNALGVYHQILPITKPYHAFLNTLKSEFNGLPMDITEQNVHARCRGTLMMALSNKKQKLVLTTGNKSEIAVGYCTLYGDMAGGFCVLKDLSKTGVYRLAHYRNKISPVIPVCVIDRAPTAELAPNQTDQDTLPPYDVLDQIIELYVEKNESVDAIVAQGFDENTVRQIVCLINKSEYKRRQAPPGVRITPRAFGRDRRYPITSGF